VIWYPPEAREKRHDSSLAVQAGSIASHRKTTQTCLAPPDGGFWEA